MAPFKDFGGGNKMVKIHWDSLDEGVNQFSQVVLWPPHRAYGMHKNIHTYAHKINNVYFSKTVKNKVKKKKPKTPRAKEMVQPSKY